MLTLSLFVVGCGAISDPNEEKNNDNNPTTNSSPSLSQITGIYDASREINHQTDEIYLVIRSNGSFIYYDHEGDSFNNGDNCYHKRLENFTESALGIFLSELTSIISTIELVEGKILITKGNENYVFPRSDRKESEFAPLCD